MGIFASCLKGSNDDVPSSTGPDAVLKRQQMAEAAEKRLKEQESRGVKDPEKLRRQQQRQAELDRELGAAERSPNDANLRVNPLSTLSGVAVILPFPQGSSYYVKFWR
ncbi:unnamed protein product [Ixodes persulcatus]